MELRKKHKRSKGDYKGPIFVGWKPPGEKKIYHEVGSRHDPLVCDAIDNFYTPLFSKFNEAGSHLIHRSGQGFRLRISTGVLVVTGWNAEETDGGVLDVDRKALYFS